MRDEKFQLPLIISHLSPDSYRDLISHYSLSIINYPPMAEFMMLFRGGSSRPTPTPEQSQAEIQQWAQWMGGLAEKGKMLGAQPLRSGGKTVSGTKMIVTDGPFMEGKEMVGGYLICKADSFDEATEIAKGCPILQLEDGNVEIREINQMMM
jgi:hypothetical protein